MFTGVILSAQFISSIGQIIKSLCLYVSQSVSQSVCLSHETSWTLYRSQSSTDLHQTCHQGRVLGDVVNYCFRWKSAKPEEELLFINSFGKIALKSNISKTVTDTTMASMEVEYKTAPGLSYTVLSVILGLAIFIQLRFVTNGQTDRQTDTRWQLIPC